MTTVRLCRIAEVESAEVESARAESTRVESTAAGVRILGWRDDEVQRVEQRVEDETARALHECIARAHLAGCGKAGTGERHGHPDCPALLSSRFIHDGYRMTECFFHGKTNAFLMH